MSIANILRTACRRSIWLCLFACSATWAYDPATGLRPGLDPQSFDPATRVQDDLYRAANGRWLDTIEIPADRDDVGGPKDATYIVDERLEKILEAAAHSGAPRGSSTQRLGDLYASAMDEASVAARGIAPLRSVFERIDAIREPSDIARVFGFLTSIGVKTPYAIQINARLDDNTIFRPGIQLNGTTLSYAEANDDARSRENKAALLSYIERILTLSGDAQASTHATRIFESEMEVLQLYQPATDNVPGQKMSTGAHHRDGIAVPNWNEQLKRGHVFHDLTTYAPHFAWKDFLETAGFGNRAEKLVIYTYSSAYLTAFDQHLADLPLDTLKAYLKYLYVDSRAVYLPQPFADAHFALYERALSGTTMAPTRARRSLDAVKATLPADLGDVYAQTYFTARHDATIRAMARNLKQIFSQDISAATWMSADTREHALHKLDTMRILAGAPEHTPQSIDLSRLQIARDDLFGNVERAARARHNHILRRLDDDFKGTEWRLNAFEYNAAYDPDHNAVDLPAALMLPPFFVESADAAVEYATLGVTIGHEIAHAFDNNGANYDADGKQRDWWTEEDRETFKNRIQMLASQYNGYSPLAGHFFNGETTLNENIADNVSVDAAYRAYRLSLEGQPAPVIDGMTADQRFFYEYAQSRREKRRESSTLNVLEYGVYATSEFRVNGPARNSAAFHQVFDVKPGDKLYLAPSERFTLW